MFVDQKGHESRGDFTIKWTSKPCGVEYTHPPHMCGFTATNIEVRSALNGATLMVIPFKTSVVLLHDPASCTVYTAHNSQTVYDTDKQTKSACTLHKVTYAVS